MSEQAGSNPLHLWWQRTVKKFPGLVDVFSEDFRLRTSDVPLEELRALSTRHPELEQLEVLDPCMGVYSWIGRWPGGCIRVYNVRTGEIPSYVHGAVAESAKRDLKQTQRHMLATVGISAFCPVDKITADLLNLLTPHSRERRRARMISGRQCTINVLTAGVEGLRTEAFRLPRRRCKLIPENYRPEIVAQFADMVRFIQGRTPLDAGRLALIDGPPGTGKTFLIQALLSHKSTCVLVPGAAGAMLDNPAFIPWVVNYCSEANGATLVIEDADEILRDRDRGGSLSALSGLLNATSGMMSTLTNLRVLATVNTDSGASTVDPAVLRAGRLFRRLHIGTLSQEQARAVVLRESGSELAAARVPDTGLSLADCYAYARALGVPEPA